VVSRWTWGKAINPKTSNKEGTNWQNNEVMTEQIYKTTSATQQ
jgi:hypothetical protein